MTKRPVPANVVASWEYAKQLRSPWEGRWQRLVDLAMPYRTDFFGNAPGQAPEPLYDETGVTALDEFANRLQTGLMPEGVEWAHYELPPDARDTDKAAMAETQAYMFGLLSVANFATEGNDWFKDIGGFGNGCIRVRGGDWRSPLLFNAVPLPNVFITPGPWGGWADIHVRHLLPPYVVRQQWPGIELPERQRDHKDPAGLRPLQVLESWIRDLESPTERWVRVIHLEGKILLHEAVFEGLGSCELVFTRWSKGSGELYGAGQGMLALPAIETANQIVGQDLRGGELRMAGVYQAEDDGILNPATVVIAPGSIIPIAPGSRGLQPLATGRETWEAQTRLEEQRYNIRKALFSDQLGKREGTPPTAFEVEERLNELSRAVGPALTRVWTEGAIPLLNRIRHVLDKKGLARLPMVDGRKVKAVPVSAIARAQKSMIARRAERWAGTIAQLYGPQALPAMVPADRFARFTGEHDGVPANLLFTPDEMADNAKAAGDLVGKLGAGGGDMAPLLASLGMKA